MQRAKSRVEIASHFSNFIKQSPLLKENVNMSTDTYRERDKKRQGTQLCVCSRDVCVGAGGEN